MATLQNAEIWLNLYGNRRLSPTDIVFLEGSLAPTTSYRLPIRTLVPFTGMKLKEGANRAKSARARSPAASTSLPQPPRFSDSCSLRSFPGAPTDVSSQPRSNEQPKIARTTPDQERSQQSSSQNDRVTGGQINVSSDAKPKSAQGSSDQGSSDGDTPMPNTTTPDVETSSSSSSSFSSSSLDAPTESDYNGDGSDHDPGSESDDDFYGHNEPERRRTQSRWPMDGHWEGSDAAKDSEDDGYQVEEPSYESLEEYFEMSAESVDTGRLPVHKRRNYGGLWQDWGLKRQKGVKPGNGQLF